MGAAFDQAGIDGGDVAGIVLAVAINADDILETEFVGELVSGLDAAAEAEMARKRHDFRSGLPGDEDSGVGRAIVDDKDRNSRQFAMHGLDDVPDGTFFVESRNDHQ